MLACWELLKQNGMGMSILLSWATIVGPVLGFPGAGGANDAASHSKRIVILIPHEESSKS